MVNPPNGVDVGPDGNIYVASVFESEITVHDPDSGEVIDRIASERGVDGGPDDVVIAPDGTLYWTEFHTGNVGMLRPDGTFHEQSVGLGVNPIALSDDGRLFAAHRAPSTGPKRSKSEAITTVPTRHRES